MSRQEIMQLQVSSVQFHCVFHKLHYNIGRMLSTDMDYIHGRALLLCTPKVHVHGNVLCTEMIHILTMLLSKV